MSKEEFISAYCARSGVTWDELSQRREAIPCDCGEEICGGWQMVPKEESHDAGDLQK